MVFSITRNQNEKKYASIDIQCRYVCRNINTNRITKKEGYSK